MPDPNDPTPQTVPAANPVVTLEPATPAPGTVNDHNGEAPAASGQAAPVEETFTNVDPNSLPPKERVAYDNMLRDYKKKTAEIAELRRKAEAHDAWQREQASKQRITDEDYNRAFESKDGMTQFLQKAAEPVVQELQQTKMELASTKADLFIKDFKAKHPDFEDLDSDGLITGYVQLNPPKGEPEWGTRMKEAYAYAKKLRSKWEDAGYKRGITRVEEKAAQSTELPSSSPAQVYPGGDPTKLTAKEAVELARRGIRVPR
jgi:hypothetical protein